jgi:integrase
LRSRASSPRLWALADSGGIIDLDSIWAAYRLAALGELDRSPRTVARYETSWRECQAWTQQPAGEAAVLEGVIAYRESLRRRRLAGNTIHTQMAALSAVWRWAFEARMVDLDPLRRLRLPRQTKNPRPAIDRAAFEDLISRLPQLPPVDRVIIGLAAYAGLRRSEIRNLNLEDLDLEERAIVVRQGKGRKDRIVRMHPDLADLLRTTRQAVGISAPDRIRGLCRRDRLSLAGASIGLGLTPSRLAHIVAGNGIRPETAQLLARWDGEWPVEAWLASAGSYRRFGASRGRPLIVGSKGGRIGSGAVWRTVRSYIDACPHQFRTTWITILLEHQVPVQIVAEEAGHATLDTTRAYVGRRDNLARERMDEVRFGPAAPVLRLLPPAEAEPEGDQTPSWIDAWDPEVRAAWEAVVQRNPWAGALVMTAVRSGDQWMALEIELWHALRHDGADPLEPVEYAGNPSTLWDLYAIAQYIGGGCSQPPECLYQVAATG